MITHTTTHTRALFGAAGQPLFTSAQAAASIGISRPALIVLLSRHPELHPVLRVGVDLFWSEGEITAAARKRATAKRGRPAR